MLISENLQVLVQAKTGSDNGWTVLAHAHWETCSLGDLEGVPFSSYSLMTFGTAIRGQG